MYTPPSSVFRKQPAWKILMILFCTLQVTEQENILEKHNQWDPFNCNVYDANVSFVMQYMIFHS